MKRELRYTVLKNKDVEKYLDGDDISLLVAICDKVTLGRFRDGKPALQCVVVESDWPEYEPTWAAIESRVDAEACGDPQPVREIKVTGWHWPNAKVSERSAAGAESARLPGSTPDDGETT